MLEIKKLTKEDLPIIAKFFSDNFSSNGLGEPWGLENSFKHIEEVFNEEYSIKAIDNNELVGGLIAYPATYERGTEFYIDTIVVKTDKQRKGIGTQLINYAINSAKNKNLIGVRIITNHKIPAYKWYRKIGLKDSGWVEMVKFF